MINGSKNGKIDQKWVKNMLFLNLLKRLVVSFYLFVLFGMFLHKSHIWENFSFWVWAKMFSDNHFEGIFH